MSLGTAKVEIQQAVERARRDILPILDKPAQSVQRGDQALLQGALQNLSAYAINFVRNPEIKTAIEAEYKGVSSEVLAQKKAAKACKELSDSAEFIPKVLAQCAEEKLQGGSRLNAENQLSAAIINFHRDLTDAERLIAAVK